MQTLSMPYTKSSQGNLHHVDLKVSERCVKIYRDNFSDLRLVVLSYNAYFPRGIKYYTSVKKLYYNFKWTSVPLI